MQKCDICGEYTAQCVSEHNILSYQQISDAIPSYFMKCSSCGSEYATPQQTQLNKKIFIEFKQYINTTR